MDDNFPSRQPTLAGNLPNTSAPRNWIAGIVVLVAAVTLAAVLNARAESRDSRRADAERALAADTIKVGGAAHDALERVDRVTRALIAVGSPAILGRAAPPEGSTAIAFVSPLAGGALTLTAGTLPADVLSSAELAATTGQARDEATARLSAPIGRRHVVAAVEPVYSRTKRLLALDPGGTTTTERRAALFGWVVTLLDGDALATEVRGDIAVRDGSDTITATAGRDGSDDGPTLTLPVPGRSWTVSANTVDTPLVPNSAVWPLVFGLAAMLAIVLAARAMRTRRAVAEERAAAYHAQAEMIRRFAPVVQQSLDLADVLPALAVQLLDELDLAGMALAAVGTSRTEYELFSVGEVGRRDLAPPAQLHVPTSLAAGEQLTLSLQRGGRAVATLRLRAGRDLGQTELESVQAACELTTAAMVNARTFEQQQEAVNQLRAVDELKTIFLGTASHELRTPVTAITGFAVLLDERWDQLSTSDRRLFAHRIAQNCRFLESLVQDLLDFSRLERGRLVVTVDEVSLGELVTDITERLAPFWPTHRLETAITTSPQVVADRAGVDRVLTNLVSNAVKFSPEGSTVRVTVDQSDGMGCVIVDDEGPGVPAADRARVFTSFFRGAGIEVVRTRGAGIGLSVAKQYLDQMGGTIAVDESPAGGARFIVGLRLAASERETALSAADQGGIDAPQP